MRFAFDSNVLIYAVDTGTPAKHEIARRIVENAFEADAVLVTQTLGEYLSVFTRKYPKQLAEARAAAELWIELLPLADSTGDDVIAASRYALKHRLQYWDSLILVVAASAGADFLLSEDMHDGLSIEGLTIIDPFNPANSGLIDVMLRPTEEIDRP